MLIKIIKGSPASKVLKAGDYIVSLDGNRAYSSSTLRGLLHDKTVGSSFQITYFRKGKIRTSIIKTVNSYFDLRQEDIIITKQDKKITKKRLKGRTFILRYLKNLYGVPKIKRSITRKDKKNKVTPYQKNIVKLL